MCFQLPVCSGKPAVKVQTGLLPFPDMSRGYSWDLHESKSIWVSHLCHWLPLYQNLILIRRRWRQQWQASEIGGQRQINRIICHDAIWMLEAVVDQNSDSGLRPLRGGWAVGQMCIHQRQLHCGYELTYSIQSERDERGIGYNAAWC